MDIVYIVLGLGKRLVDMQVYVVSIEQKDSPRLLKFLSQSFFQKGIKYTQVGIKGGELAAKLYFDQAVKGRKRPLSPGELGCSLSHLQALELFLKTEEKCALIFEDDAILPDFLEPNNLAEQIQTLNLPENILLSLGGIQMKECKKVRGKFIDRQIFDRKILAVVPDFYRRVNYAVAYVVDRKMAETLLAYHQPIRCADDWSYLYDFNSSVNLWMTHLIDHPVIARGENNLALSTLEVERSSGVDVAQSRYGTWWGKNLSKILNHKYSK